MVRDEAKESLTIEMRSAWWTAQKTFSSYTLEIIAHNLGRVEFADSAALLRDTISAQTDRITTILAGAPQVENVLSQIRGLLQTKAPYESILDVLESRAPQDPVLLLGQIAWFSQFKHEHAMFGADDLTRWFQGATRHAAESLLAEGVAAGIFSLESAESYKWEHGLVRDGCAAMYLREQFGAIKRETAAEMARRLNDAGSVEILALAFDSAMLQKTISDLLFNPQNLGDILDHLLAGQMLMRLAQTPDTVDVVATSIFAASQALIAETTQEPRKVSATLSRAIARLRPLSKRLDAYVTGPMDQHGPRVPVLVGAGLIGQECNPQIFADLRRRFAPMDTVLDMAVHLWRFNGFDTLITEFSSNMGLNREQIASLLQVFVDRSEESFLFEKIQDITDGEFLNEYGSNEQVACIACRSVLKRSFELKPVTDLTLTGALCRAAERQIDQGRLYLGGELARWASCALNRDVAFREAEWTGYKLTSEVRSEDGRLLAGPGAYALPWTPSSPETLRQILPKVYSSAVDRQSRGVLTLPAKAELELVKVECTELELVRDYLPERYVYDESRLPPGAELATWNGRIFTHIDTRFFDRNKDTIHWRPKMCLSQGAKVFLNTLPKQ